MSNLNPNTIQDRALHIMKAFGQDINIQKGGAGSGPHKKGQERKEPTHGYIPEDDWQDEDSREHQKHYDRAFKEGNSHRRSTEIANNAMKEKKKNKEKKD